MSPAQYAVCQFIIQHVQKAYEIKAACENSDAITAIERYTILSAIDKLWQEHLYGMDSLRGSIGLRAYGQRDPLLEYKAEAYKMFQELMVNIKTEICHNIFRSASSLMAFENFLRRLPQRTIHQEARALGQPSAPPARMGRTAPRPSTTSTTTTTTTGASKPGSGGDLVTQAAAAIEKAKPARSPIKVGRNEPCPCGSGKKYKQCCGRF
jgi:preprotein translocase subunit SecA